MSVTIKQICLGPNTEKIQYMLMSRGYNLGSNKKRETGNKFFESVVKIKFWKQQ